MRKLVLDVKSTLALAPKTVDRDYEVKHKLMVEIDKAVREYLMATDRMKAAAKSVSQALVSVTAALNALTADVDTSDSVKSVAKTYDDSIRAIRDDDLAAYTKAIDSDCKDAVQNIKDDIAELKKVDQQRQKFMTDFDVYRDLVSSKEKEYKKKGKTLSDSKNYNEDVQKRDYFENLYNAENTKYKVKADAIYAAQLGAYLDALKVFTAKTAAFFFGMSKNVNNVTAAAKYASL